MEDINGNTETKNWLEGLYPGYFTLTMATGIIAIGLGLLESPVLADIMYSLTLVSWAVLFAIYSWRLVRYPRAVWSDLINPQLTFNFFTFVAATSVCGLLVHQHGHHTLALAAWLAALLAWSMFLYFSFGSLMLLHGERSLKIVDGGWLVCIVGTESLVLLGLKIIPLVGDYDALTMMVVFMLWGLGLMLYGIFVTLFSYRIFFMEMKYSDYTPQMWVIMGAAAISANASSALDMSDPVINVIAEVHPVIDSMALLTWAWATWWIPLLVVIGFWRHAVKKVPIRYEPRQWSIVFPLGMYTVASVQLSMASEVDPLHWISHVTVWVAVLAWGLLAAGLSRQIWRGLLGRPSVA